MENFIHFAGSFKTRFHCCYFFFAVYNHWNIKILVLDLITWIGCCLGALIVAIIHCSEDGAKWKFIDSLKKDLLGNYVHADGMLLFLSDVFDNVTVDFFLLLPLVLYTSMIITIFIFHSPDGTLLFYAFLCFFCYYTLLCLVYCLNYIPDKNSLIRQTLSIIKK